MKMEFALEGSSVIVTGGGCGIGRPIYVVARSIAAHAGQGKGSHC
jgi:hypothetical protein